MFFSIAPKHILYLLWVASRVLQITWEPHLSLCWKTTQAAGELGCAGGVSARAVGGTRSPAAEDGQGQERGCLQLLVSSSHEEGLWTFTLNGFFFQFGLPVALFPNTQTGLICNMGIQKSWQSSGAQTVQKTNRQPERQWESSGGCGRLETLPSLHIAAGELLARYYKLWGPGRQIHTHILTWKNLIDFFSFSPTGLQSMWSQRVGHDCAIKHICP